MKLHTLPPFRFALVGLAALALSSIGASAAGAEAVAPPGACPDGSGVTVVVDFTDLDGDVVVGCATDATTGTEALTSAGFADTRDASGLICAIDALPDPCPETFTGSYWSYWHAEGDGWEAWAEGSDTAVPEPGGVEGWRYSDGTSGPAVSPTDVRTATGAVAGDDGSGAAETAQPTTPGDGNPWVLAGAGAAILAAALVALVVLVRRGRSPHGPYGQD